jgi:hypothetical protein
MSEQSERIEITATDLLARLAGECRKLVDASGLEDGQGGGWESYDCLLVELRTLLKAAEVHLAHQRETCSNREKGCLCKPLDCFEPRLSSYSPPACSPRIVQLLMTPQDATWQGRLIGLGSDGETYSVNYKGFWELFVPALGVTENEGMSGPNGQSAR